MGNKATNGTHGKAKSDLVVGRKGIIRIGNSENRVEVVEDRGPVGYKGRRLVRVRRIDPDTDQSSTFEVASDELIMVGADKKANRLHP